MSGTHISNTRDAAAFALISEEGIAKGVRRITTITAECASQAMKLASSIETDINEASKLLDGATLEKVLSSSLLCLCLFSMSYIYGCDTLIYWILLKAFGLFVCFLTNIMSLAFI